MSDATTIETTQIDPPDLPAEQDRAYLVVRRGEHTQVVDLAEGDEIVIGRSAEATVQLDDAKASREHARVKRQDGQLLLADLGSRNGTWLNQELLRGAERAVVSGDRIRIGRAEIVVAGLAGARPADGGRRLEAELERAASRDGKAALVRVAVDRPDALAKMAPALAGAALVEAQGAGEYACLLAESDPEAVQRFCARLRELAPEALVTSVRLPDDGDRLDALWQKARQAAHPDASLRTLARARAVAPPGVVVADEAMVKVFELVRRVAAAPTTVLILGETGVGKEVVAEQVHRQSPRAKGPFVRLNCSSLPETLLESELFGYEKGAFTGAERRKIGYLEAADGGTLFLDEIGELALAMQAKLLRVIETKRFMRVGGREEIAVDARIVSATNRDLESEAKAGRFREDLYFRLATFTLRIPPLRERPAEVALLGELFAREIAQRMEISPKTIAPDAAAALRRYRWPGNVRELRNAIEHAVVMVDGAELHAEHLPEPLRKNDGPATPAGAMKEHLAGVEQRAIEEALAAENGNQTRAAKRLGISRRALIYKLAKYGIKR